MTSMKPVHKPDLDHRFQFESYGVKVEVTSNKPEMIEQAAGVVRKTLLGDIRASPRGKLDHHFDLNQTKGGTYIITQNGRRLASGRSRRKFLQFFDSMVCVAVGEFAVDRVFMHAGVVGWKGKAIVIPGNSFQGKTTLVAELVRRGAAYYSDEFAIFDKDGLVHPFSRPLSMRSRNNGKLREHELTPELLGGTYGTEPIEVGTVLLTRYAPGSRWSPKLLTPGAGVLEMIPHTLSVRHRTDFALQVLNKITSRAIIASSLRGTAEKFAKTLLNFVDKHGY